MRADVRNIMDSSNQKPARSVRFQWAKCSRAERSRHADPKDAREIDHNQSEHEHAHHHEFGTSFVSTMRLSCRARFPTCRAHRLFMKCLAAAL